MDTPKLDAGGMVPDPVREAERCCLGAMLREPGVIAEVFEVLAPDDFWPYHHRLLAQTIADLYDARQPVDLVTVATRLFAKKQAADVTPAYLAELWQNTFSTDHASEHAKIVLESSRRRKLDQTLSELLASIRSDFSSPADDLVTFCQTRLLSLSTPGRKNEVVHIRDAVKDALARYEAMTAGESSSGQSTGLPNLDTILGGLRPSELIILAARPSVGKTALACRLILHTALREKCGVLFVSLEQSRAEIAERLLAMHGKLHAQKLRQGQLPQSDLRILLETSEGLVAGPIWIADKPYQSMQQICTAARRYHLSDFVGLVVVDYLQLIQPENKKAPREEQVALISRRLKGLARELEIPVLALAQLNRDVEKRADKKPTLADLRESGSIEADADVVLLMHPQERQPGNKWPLIDLLIAKHRNGPTGEVSLVYQAECMRFESLAQDEWAG